MKKKNGTSKERDIGSKASTKGRIEIPGRGIYHLENQLNDMTNKEWLKFQKSWFILNPRPRKEDVLLHPAKFPEELIRDFVSFFTKRGQVVLDPMAGTGSSMVAAIDCYRSSIGIELQEKYAKIAQERVDEALERAKGSVSGNSDITSGDQSS